MATPAMIPIYLQPFGAEYRIYCRPLPRHYAVASVGYTLRMTKKGKGGKRFLEIDLKYSPDGRGAINDIQLVSKPGRCVYTKSGKLRQ